MVSLATIHFLEAPGATFPGDCLARLDAPALVLDEVGHNYGDGSVRLRILRGHLSGPLRSSWPYL